MIRLKPQLNELNIHDVQRVLSLVRRVFLEYNAPSYGERGLQSFLSFITEENIKELCRNPDNI